MPTPEPEQEPIENKVIAKRYVKLSDAMFKLLTVSVMTTYINLGPYNFVAFENVRSTEGTNKLMTLVADDTGQYEGEWNEEGKMHGRGALLMIDEENK